MIMDVIQFSDFRSIDRPTKLPLEPKRREGFCQHPHVFVCEQSRQLECSICEQIIDPFDYLYEWACKDRNLMSTRDALRKEIEKLKAELEALKRDERNTKQRLKRLKS